MERKARTSCYLGSEFPSSEILLSGLSHFANLVRSGTALIAFDAKKTLKNVESVFGKKAVKDLSSGLNYPLTDGLSLRLWTPGDNVYRWEGPVLAVYTSASTLDQLDDLFDVNMLFVIPWTNEGVKEWVCRWESEDLRDPSKSMRYESPLPGVVKNALIDISGAVNLSTGIGHSMDRAAMVSMFKCLRDEGYIFDSGQIKGYLISNESWEARHAEDVRKLVDDILARKKIRWDDPAWRGKTALKRWDTGNL